MNKVQKVLLSIAIAFVFVFFVAYGIEVVFDSPEYDDYCKIDRYSKPIPYGVETKNCTFLDYGEEEYQCMEDGGQPYPNYDENGCTIDYSCDYCYKELNDANESHNKIVFIISTIIGIIVLVTSLVIPKDAVSSGLMAGSILLILYGVIRYWGGLQDYFRLFILGLILAILIWVGYKYIPRDGETKKEEPVAKKAKK